MKMLKLAAALILLLFLPCATFGEIYGWVDENGVKNYSNDPPPAGVTVFTQQTEIATDEAQDQKRTESDQQFFNEMKQQAPEDETRSQQADSAMEESEAADNEVAEDDDDQAFHQERIERRTRVNSSPNPGPAIRPGSERPTRKEEKARINPRTNYKTHLPK